MTRVVKNPEVRRNEIIDVAHQLFLTKGYDNTSVQDVLDGVGIAKGTFYYYFDSKLALLDSLIARLTDDTLATVEPIITDDHLSALEKIDGYFDTIMSWKTERREFFMDFARVIYRDENAIYLQKMVHSALRRVAPFFAKIISQGNEEGVFDNDYPVETAEIILILLRSMSESMTYILLEEEYAGDIPSALERIILSHQDAMSRILGYDGAMELIDLDTAKLWADVAASNRAVSTSVTTA